MSRPNAVYLVAEGLNEAKRRKARGCPEPRTTERSEGVRGQVIQPHAESRSDDVVDAQHRPHPGTPPEDASYPRTPLRSVRGLTESVAVRRLHANDQFGAPPKQQRVRGCCKTRFSS